MNTHETYMLRCLELAEKGLGQAAPNPLVGAVIVHDGRILGEGFHQKYGEAHAEVNAVNSVEDKNLLKESTLYVSLEPCNHTGKTPPCTELIIQHKIPEVVIGTQDSHSIVNGRGIETLEKNGIRVLSGILENPCRLMNRRFFTYHEHKRPYIILKWAQTADYFLDRVRKNNEPAQPNWITSEDLRTLVHKWRSEEPGLLIGSKTAICDNPRLTTRLWPGKNPLRIVIDTDSVLSETLNVFSPDAETLIYSISPLSYQGKNIHARGLPFSHELAHEITEDLHSRRIQSVMVEGGRQTLQLFIDSNLWDEARVFTGTLTFGNGVPAPRLRGKKISTRKFGDTTLDTFVNHSNNFYTE